MIEYDRERYRVTRDGIVLSMRSNGAWKSIHMYRAAGNGYWTVRLWSNYKRIGVQVHRLVAQEFLPPKPFPDAVVRHVDGNQDNNAADNLEWGTQSQNIAEMHEHARQRSLEDARERVLQLEKSNAKLRSQVHTLLDINAELTRRNSYLESVFNQEELQA